MAFVQRTLLKKIDTLTREMAELPENSGKYLSKQKEREAAEERLRRSVETSERMATRVEIPEKIETRIEIPEKIETLIEIPLEQFNSEVQQTFKFFTTHKTVYFIPVQRFILGKEDIVFYETLKNALLKSARTLTKYNFDMKYEEEYLTNLGFDEQAIKYTGEANIKDCAKYISLIEPEKFFVIDFTDKKVMLNGMLFYTSDEIRAIDNRRFPGMCDAFVKDIPLPVCKVIRKYHEIEDEDKDKIPNFAYKLTYRDKTDECKNRKIGVELEETTPPELKKINDLHELRKINANDEKQRELEDEIGINYKDKLDKKVEWDKLDEEDKKDELDSGDKLDEWKKRKRDRKKRMDEILKEIEDEIRQKFVAGMQYEFFNECRERDRAYKESMFSDKFYTISDGRHRLVLSILAMYNYVPCCVPD